MHETNPDYVTDPDPSTITSWLIALAVLLCGVIALWGTFTGPETATDPHLEPVPPSPSSTTWSDECTAEDLDDGACLTWDDIRNQPTYTQAP